MSEPIGTSIKIGGELPASMIKKFLEVVHDELSDIVGPTTEEELRASTGTVSYQGTSNYGLAEKLTKFCKANKLSYICQSDAKYEYDGTMEYWVPGMKCPFTINSTQDGDAMVKIDTIRPLCDFMLDTIKHGKDAIAKYVGDERFSDLITKITKNYSKLPKILEKEINGILPTLPKIPPLVIKE